MTKTTEEKLDEVLIKLDAVLEILLSQKKKTPEEKAKTVKEYIQKRLDEDDFKISIKNTYKLQHIKVADLYDEYLIYCRRNKLVSIKRKFFVQEVIDNFSPDPTVYETFYSGYTRFSFLVDPANESELT